MCFFFISSLQTKRQSEAFFGAIYASGVGTSIEEKQYYIKAFTKTGFHGGLNYYRATRMNFDDDLEYIGKPYTVPSLMVVVEKDPILTPEFVAVFKDDLFEDMQNDSIEEGGHNVHTENPEGLNRVLDAYLTKFFAKNGVQKEA
ncbi:Bifunctional epoxide hydrolase 2 [Mortierella polycephala]|uniref:Bifunctional epoxide hydrolase 2 n=1 Tax=Mortierella polycephala TaxID=41804 RepID=A0A9P6PMA9_9FUNG|nr:Bifunctional epoxide hydrolase 2 [Mortierella polycephala]